MKFFYLFAICYCSDAFDVIRESKDHVTLVDFSPLDVKYVEPLAFEWSELERDRDVIVML